MTAVRSLVALLFFLKGTDADVFWCNAAAAANCTGADDDPCPVKISSVIAGYAVDDVIIMTYEFAESESGLCDGADGDHKCEAYSAAMYLKIEAGEPTNGDFETGPEAATLICPHACLDPSGAFSGVCQDPAGREEDGLCEYGQDNTEICSLPLSGGTITHQCYSGTSLSAESSPAASTDAGDPSDEPPAEVEGPQCSSTPTTEINDTPDCGVDPASNLCHVAVAGFEVGTVVTINYIQHPPDDDSMCTENNLVNNCDAYGGGIYAEVVSTIPVEGTPVELSQNGIIGLCQSPCMAGAAFTGVCQLLPPETETCVEPGTNDVCDVALLGVVDVSIFHGGESSGETTEGEPGEETPSTGEATDRPPTTIATTSNAFKFAGSAVLLLTAV